MTLRYESEILFDLMKRDGDDTPSDVLPYESELKEKYLEQVEGAYPKLQDYRSEWLNYNLVAHLPADFPVETVSNVTEATVDNVVPYAYKSAILTGQTLVNIHPKTYHFGMNNSSIFSADVDIDISLIKPNTKYFIRIYNAPSNIASLYFKPCDKPTINFTDINNKYTIHTTKSDLSEYANAGRIHIYTSTGTTATEEDVKNVKVIICEYQDGMENRDITYFEGIQSVKMPVLTTTGENLFYSTLEYGDFNHSTGIPSGSSKTIIRTKEYNEILSNKTYCITVFNAKASLSTFFVHEYDNDFNYIKSTSSNVFTTSANTKYIKFRFRKSNSSSFTQEELVALSCMITKGSTIPTAYEPYKSNILTVNEDVILRGIGDVQDKLDCLTGEVTESIGEIVLDGTQYMASDGYGVYIEVNDVKRFLDYTDKIACDKLPVIPTHQELENVENGISGFSNSVSYLGQNWLYVKINNSVNTDEVKEWLTQKPITVQYQLATESVKTVDLTVTDQDGNTKSIITPIEGTMYLSTSGETIKPSFSGEIPVEAITQNLASFIGE